MHNQEHAVSKSMVLSVNFESDGLTVSEDSICLTVEPGVSQCDRVMRMLALRVFLTTLIATEAYLLR